MKLRFIMVLSVVFLTSLLQAQNGPYGVVSPPTVDFGPVLVDQTSPQQRITLKNTGNSELIVSNISISTNFAISNNQCANGVKPGTHCNVYITFTPPGLGTYTGTLTFTDNASNSPQTVALVGTGSDVAGPTIPPITLYFTQGWAEVSSSGTLADSFLTANGSQSMNPIPDDFDFTNGVVQCVNGCSTDQAEGSWNYVQFTPPGNMYQTGWGYIIASIQNVNINGNQLTVSGPATGSATFLPCVWQGENCIDIFDTTYVLDAQFNYAAVFTGGPDIWYLQDAYMTSSDGQKVRASANEKKEDSFTAKH